MRWPLLAVLAAVTAVPAAAEDTVAVVVAAVDIPEGTTVTMEMISQRQAPKSAVTSSVVKPGDASYIVNQRILYPVLAGDLLQWTLFETTRSSATDEACRRKMAQPDSAEAQIARHRQAALKPRR